MSAIYDAIAIERGEKALFDAQPIADDLARLLDANDTDPTRTVAAAHDLALSFERVSMYLSPDSGYAAHEYKEAAHAGLFETLDDAASALKRLRPRHPHGTPLPAKDVQTCRDALAAYQAIRAACLGPDTDTTVQVTATRTRLARVTETYTLDGTAWTVDNSAHGLACPKCEDMARSAAINARVTGATGATYRTTTLGDQPDHYATVTRQN